MSNKYYVSLRVRHPHADSESIVRGIGLSPKRYWKAGDRRTTPNGSELDGVNRNSVCLFDLGGAEDKELSDFLDEALDSLNAAAEFLLQFRQTGGTADFYVSWEQGDGRGESFSIALLSRMVHLGIDLGIQPIW